MKLKYKKSYKEAQNHAQDDILNMGYKYWERGILNRVISSELYSNPVMDGIYKKIDDLFIYLVHTAKQLRTQFSIAHDKDTIWIN